MSVKGFQCLNNEWPVARSNYKLPTYYGMGKQDLENMFMKTNTNKSITLNKRNNQYYMKHNKCPFRRFMFEKNKLVDEGNLYFEGFWFYESVNLADR